MNIAIIDNNSRIINVIVADKSFISDKYKYLSKRSELWMGDVYSEEQAFIEDLEKEPEDVTPDPAPALKEILITGVQNAEKVSSDFTKITASAKQSDNAVALAVVSGTVDLPDSSFSVPMESVNVATGASTVIYKQIEIIGGQFSFVLDFPSGKYIINSKLLNTELLKPMFTVKPTEIYLVI